MGLVEIHNDYLYISSKKCVGSVTFRRARGLTDCASYDTLAKLTTPQHLSIRFTQQLLHSNSPDTQQLL